MKELENELNRFKAKIESANQLIEELSFTKEKIDSSYQVILEVREFFDSQNKRIESILDENAKKLEGDFNIQLDSIRKNHEYSVETIDSLDKISDLTKQNHVEQKEAIELISEVQVKSESNLASIINHKFDDMFASSKKNELSILTQLSSGSESFLKNMKDVESRTLSAIIQQSNEIQGLVRNVI
jgi:hypothetical protein